MPLSSAAVSLCRFWLPGGAPAVSRAVRATACAAFLAGGLGACAPAGGDDWRNGQVEDHVDPGPFEIADALARDYGTTDSAAAPDTLRGMRVWRDRDDGDWVYVERTAEGQTPERTVYQVGYGGAGAYTAHVYAVPDGVPPLAEAGAAGADPLDGLTPEALDARAGCTLVFDRTGPGAYVGVTEGTACAPTAPAASHALTEIRVDDGLSVWSRDVDADGAQAAGPTAPTVYRRAER